MSELPNARIFLFLFYLIFILFKNSNKKNGKKIINVLQNNALKIKRLTHSTSRNYKMFEYLVIQK